MSGIKTCTQAAAAKATAEQPMAGWEWPEAALGEDQVR